ncbi:hypothetical protein UMZ34_00265 [Halopseudomonas pachastrellae]|nr:hypothetical protein UMZ34_00265 [Halopseudomonas pachastrellae]
MTARPTTSPWAQWRDGLDWFLTRQRHVPGERRRAYPGAATDLPGINSQDFNDETGALYASQVFLGDALWKLIAQAPHHPD